MDGTIGLISSWKGNDDVREGEQEIIGIVDGERIDYELLFIKPFESTSVTYITTISLNDNETFVKWGFVGKMNYPMNALLLIMDMEKMIGGDLEFGLNRLKEIMESQKRLSRRQPFLDDIVLRNYLPNSFHLKIGFPAFFICS